MAFFRIGDYVSVAPRRIRGRRRASSGGKGFIQAKTQSPSRGDTKRCYNVSYPVEDNRLSQDVSECRLEQSLIETMARKRQKTDNGATPSLLSALRAPSVPVPSLEDDVPNFSRSSMTVQLEPKFSGSATGGTATGNNATKEDPLGHVS